MTYIEQLMKEHQEIIELVDVTRELLTRIYSEESQTHLLNQITILTESILAHLINEEDLLYPEFLKSSDIRIRAKADVFITELQDLKLLFYNFKNQFLTIGQINEDLEVSQNTIGNILDAIENRIHKEDTDLFLVANTL